MTTTATLLKKNGRMPLQNGIKPRTPHKATAMEQELADLRGRLEAISRSQAAVHFSLDGRELSANKNFLKLFNYTIQEVEGQPHGLFLEAAYRNSSEYAEFWREL